jgi:methylated-DNA-protein-cysteine methyltransferase related protein
MKQKLPDQVFQLLSQVPRGKITSYGELAKAVGTHPRMIGRILHHNPDPDQYPCHRVIKSSGQVASGYAFGGPEKQQALLEKEGIIFVNGKADLKKFGW